MRRLIYVIYGIYGNDTTVFCDKLLLLQSVGKPNCMHVIMLYSLAVSTRYKFC